MKSFKPELTDKFLSNNYGNSYLIPDPKNTCYIIKKKQQFNNKYHRLCGENY